jgi:replicative DNA helicase
MLINIYSLDLEKYLLAGILRHPETFTDIDGYISEADFVNNLHKTIFGVIRQTLRSQDKVEKVLIAQKINLLALKFEDKVSDVLGYLTDLSLIQITSAGVKGIADELKLFTLRREIAETGLHIAEEMKKVDGKVDKHQLITTADAIYNGKISIWDSSAMLPENICGDLQSMITNREPGEPGLPGPYPMTHKMYGSLLRPGNITVFCSRAGAGKTTLLNDLSFKASESYNVPVLHFDNGEMLKEELQMRMAAGLSGVPLHYIETKKYLKDRDMVERLDGVWDRVANQQFYYFNVAGKSVEEMLTVLRRFYLSKIGRGNPLIFAFDYIKSTSERNEGNRQEFELIGKMVTKFKDFISSEVIVPMVSAVQANRSGVVTNRSSDAIVDDESIFSGGDRTIFFSSQAFILRKKTFDELTAENGKWGTHKLINIKARHLGEDIKRALALVALPDGRRKSNYVNLDFHNFAVTEKGDLQQMAQALERMHISRVEKKPEDSVELV